MALNPAAVSEIVSNSTRFYSWAMTQLETKLKKYVTPTTIEEIKKASSSVTTRTDVVLKGSNSIYCQDGTVVSEYGINDDGSYSIYRIWDKGTNLSFYFSEKGLYSIELGKSSAIEVLYKVPNMAWIYSQPNTKMPQAILTITGGFRALA